MPLISPLMPVPQTKYIIQNQYMNSDWNQLPAVVVEQETPAAFKAQLARLAPVECRML